MAAVRVVRGILPDAPQWNAEIITVAALIVLSVSAAAAALPAWRASAVDPNVVLRNE
jgi:ABC-type lipoprotein release transport system permease subunit